MRSHNGKRTHLNDHILLFLDGMIPVRALFHTKDTDDPGASQPNIDIEAIVEQKPISVAHRHVRDLAANIQQVSQGAK